MIDEPYFAPLTGAPIDSRQAQMHDANAAAEVASREQMERDRALGRPRVAQPELPPIRTPILPDDFAQRVADLDGQIFARGIAVNTEGMRSLGRQRFERLLAADRKAPRSSIGAGVDLTRFDSVQYALQAFQAPGVPVRKMSEQAAGSGKERDQVRRITDFDDLWKFTSERAEVLQDIYAFHDAFGSLAFGQSILERLSPDGRLRSRFFCGGRGRKVELFWDWSSVLTDSVTSVALVQPTWHLLGWLANEQAALPSLTDLASDFFNVRSPSKAQLQIAQAVLEGFLCDLDGWPLWEFVGRKTRTSIRHERLATWRAQLAKCFLAISDFHAEVRATFYCERGFGWDSHRIFEPARHRAFIDRTLRKLLDVAFALLALGIEETFHGAIAARFQGAVLTQGKHKPKDKRASIARQLQAAFPSSHFQLEFEEVQHS